MGSYNVDLAAIDTLIHTEGKEARDKIGHEIYDESQRLVPVDTGALKASGFVDSDDDATRIGYGTDHARYQEFGTSEMAAQPYLRPSAFKRR